MNRRQVVLITGASTGLGLVLAKKIIKIDQYFVVLTSRLESRYRFSFEGIVSTEAIWVRSLDIRDHEDIIQLVTEINLKLGGIDILINNAGVSESATVEDSDETYRQRQLDVNYLGPMSIISAALPTMRKKKCGYIINISSAGGFMAMPTMSSYSASKFALEAATESLWFEVKKWNIHVSLVIPGFINSLGYLNTIRTQRCKINSKNKLSPYYHHYRGMKKLVVTNMKLTKSTNDSISEKILRLLDVNDPPLRIFTTFDAHLLYLIRKLLPSRMYLFLFYFVLQIFFKEIEK